MGVVSGAIIGASVAIFLLGMEAEFNSSLPR